MIRERVQSHNPAKQSGKEWQIVASANKQLTWRGGHATAMVLKLRSPSRAKDHIIIIIIIILAHQHKACRH